jgi:hypothetical protein
MNAMREELDDAKLSAPVLPKLHFLHVSFSDSSNRGYLFRRGPDSILKEMNKRTIVQSLVAYGFSLIVSACSEIPNYL